MGLTWVNDLTKRMGRTGRTPQNKWDGLVCQSHQNFPTSEEVPCFPGPIRNIMEPPNKAPGKMSRIGSGPGFPVTKNGSLVLPSHDFMCSSSSAISWPEELQETCGFGGEKTMGFKCSLKPNH